ncbi:hypothetical protein KK421_10110 [Clostridioides difficile]|nr:hypothetical protein [Clostridioides difficile]
MCKYRLTCNLFELKIDNYGIIFILNFCRQRDENQREIIITDLDYQAEVRKYKTIEDVVGEDSIQ